MRIRNINDGTYLILDPDPECVGLTESGSDIQYGRKQGANVEYALGVYDPCI
jgi:hypothetical protein